MPRFTAFHFTIFHRYCFFFLLQIEGLWQAGVEQIYQHHFSNTFAHWMSVCYILIILTNTFVMVICDQWSLVLLP